MKETAQCLALALLFAALNGCGSGENDVSGNGPAEEARLKIMDLRDVATRVGVLQPKKQVPIKTEVSGIITEVYVTEGTDLDKGQPMLAIDPRPFENLKRKLLLQQREAALGLDILKREYLKDSVLAGNGGVSERTMLDTRDNFNLKKIELEKIQIDIKDVNEKLEKTVLRAPISGTLLYFNVEEGQIAISATTGFSAGTDIGTIAGTGAMEVVCNISEVDYHAISPQTPTTVYLESDPAIRSAGRIFFISKAAKQEEGTNVRSFEIRVDVEKIDPKMVPGINVNVEFVFVDKKGVPALPVKFVSKENTAEGVKYYVNLKAADGRIEKRAVEVGDTDYRRYEIKSGITEKDVVVLGGQ